MFIIAYLYSKCGKPFIGIVKVLAIFLYKIYLTFLQWPAMVNSNIFQS